MKKKRKLFFSFMGTIEKLTIHLRLQRHTVCSYLQSLVFVVIYQPESVTKYTKKKDDKTKMKVTLENTI